MRFLDLESMTTSRLSRAVSTFALSFPVVVWASDCVGSVYTVKGKSMEPSLQDGDIVLVRKADILQLFNHFSVTPFDFEAKAIQDRILRTEGRQSRILSRPPLVLPGDVVVFANPMKGAFPRELNIKRVVAVGNMMVRPEDRFRSILTVPPFNMWLEGDNGDNSEDSNTYGPVSKKLLIGQVNYIVWPPSRWGAVEKIAPKSGRTWWR